MRRVRAAIVIVILMFLLAIFGHSEVRNITETMENQLQTAQKSAFAKDFTTSKTQIKTLLLYFEKQQHLLEFFVRRDTIAALSVNLHGLSAYTYEDNLQDLSSEIDKAIEQINMMEHLFFSVF